jgi:hypothetical protein
MLPWKVDPRRWRNISPSRWASSTVSPCPGRKMTLNRDRTNYSGGGGSMRLDQLIRLPELLLEPLLWLSAADGLAWTGSWLHLNWWSELLFLGCLALPLTWDVRVVLELWILEDLSDGPDGHHFILGLLSCWCEDPLNLWACGDHLRIIFNVLFVFSNSEKTKVAFFWYEYLHKHVRKIVQNFGYRFLISKILICPLPKRIQKVWIAFFSRCEKRYFVSETVWLTLW